MKNRHSIHDCYEGINYLVFSILSFRLTKIVKWLGCVDERSIQGTHEERIGKTSKVFFENIGQVVYMSTCDVHE